MKWLLEKFASIWQFLRDLATVVLPCRFSALVVFAGAALLFSDQGREFTVRLPSEGVDKVLWFWVCVFLWAFQSWYWARLVLDATFGADRAAPIAHERSPRLRWLATHTPRVLAAGSYLVAFVGSLLAGWAAWWIGAGLAVQGALFYWFLVIRRRRFVDPLLAAGTGGPPDLKRRLLVERGADPASLGSLPLLSRMILWSTLAAAAALTVWVCADAVAFGWLFGAAAVPFLGFSMIVPVGSLLVLWSSAGGRARLAESPSAFRDPSGGYPVITLLLLVAVAFSFFAWADNHRIRTLPSAESSPAGTKIDQAFERWNAQAPRAGDGRANLVVVATAGGGLRAAFWTATVLGAIQDSARTFDRQLFAVSGVSGGSLGAAAFVTLVRSEKEAWPMPKNCEADGRRTGRAECAGQAMLSQDFLAAPVAALLFPDLIQRFLPLGFPDRARALEESWEQAWRRAGFGESLWTGRGFRALWSGERHAPALLLNSTHVETGKRVIASNIDVAAGAKVFRDAYDLYALLPPNSEIRPSTAAHTSARFTYVSPAATLADGTHLVDGGYFENFGAVTAREVLKAAVERFGTKIRPVAVLISNDPELDERDLPSGEAQPPRAAKAKTWGAEVLSPLRALLGTRNARGLLATSELRALAEQSGGNYFQFRLCREPGRPDPALGWVLSAESEDQMRRQLGSEACGNAEQLRLLVEILRG